MTGFRFALPLGVLTVAGAIVTKGVAKVISGVDGADGGGVVSADGGRGGDVSAASDGVGEL